MPCTHVRLSALLATLCCAGTASAAVFTYDVSGTIVGSPLDGQTFGGYFSAAEDDVYGLALFNMGGVRTLFGTACVEPASSPGGIQCTLPTTGNAWFFGADNGAGGLAFSQGGVEYGFDATITQREPSPVPEPASLTLVLGALAGATLARRRPSAVR